MVFFLQLFGFLHGSFKFSAHILKIDFCLFESFKQLLVLISEFIFLNLFISNCSFVLIVIIIFELNLWIYFVLELHVRCLNFLEFIRQNQNLLLKHLFFLAV